MKIVTYRSNGAPERVSYGFVVDGRIVDRTDLGLAAPTVRDLLAAGLPPASILDGRTGTIALEDVTLLPPVEAHKIFCAGLNFPSHRAETKSSVERPEKPIIFARFADSLVGAGEDIEKDPAIGFLDYEGEPGVVIGKRAYHVSEADALDYVAGYTNINEGSARDWQRHSAQWVPGKTFYRSGAIGPWIVTVDEVGHLEDAVLQTHVNGELRQDVEVKEMLFTVAELIAYCSTITPLEPGDVIAAGTTGGSGAFQDPRKPLQAGDVVTVSITGLGELTNKVVDA